VVLPTSACSILSSQLNHCGVPTFNLFALLVSCSSVLSFFFVGVLCAIVVSCRLRFICSSCSCCSSSCDVFFGVLVVAAAATATAPHSASNQTTCVFSRVVSPSVLVSIDISCSGYSVRQSLHHPSTSTTALLSTRVFLCFLLRGCLFCVLLLRGCAVRRRGLMLLAVLSLFVLFLLFFAWCLLWSAARRRRRRRHHRPSLLRFVHPSRSVECIRVIVFISTSACQTFPVQPLWGTARTNRHHPSTITTALLSIHLVLCCFFFVGLLFVVVVSCCLRLLCSSVSTCSSSSRGVFCRVHVVVVAALPSQPGSQPDQIFFFVLETICVCVSRHPC
jgi:hypothetical protein